MADDLTPRGDRVRLVELVDRVLDRGVVLRGDVTISVAGVDLVYLELRLLLAGVEALSQRALPPLRDEGTDPDTRADTDTGTGPATAPGAGPGGDVG